jgi:predicted transcriptional regulator of viral defense system
MELVRATAVFESAGGVRGTSDALAAGIEERTLCWMRDAGFVEPLSRGVYHLSALPLPAYPSVAAVPRRVPRAVLCLVSALEFHGIGTQIPAAVQIALPTGVKAPRIVYPRIERFSMSPEAIRSRRATPAQVMRYAKVDRVEQVMRPYVQALM